MVRVIVAVTLAAAVQFACGFTFFGAMSGLNRMTSHAPDEVAVMDALRKELPETGTYFVPGCPGSQTSEDAAKVHEERAAAGPIVQIHYRKEGFTMAQLPAVMGMGFAHTLLTSLLAAILLWAALPGLRSYLGRVGFVAGLGVFAAASVRLSDAVWFNHHWAWVLGQSAFCVGCWVITGAVLAAVIRPAAERAAGSAVRSLAA